MTTQNGPTVQIHTRFSREIYEKIDTEKERLNLETAAQTVNIATRLGLEVLRKIPGSIQDVSSQLNQFLANS